jgi:hypothetical protein
MPNEHDLEGKQDQGGKHGGQAGMPRPEQAVSGSRSAPGKVVGDPKVKNQT